MVSNHSLLGKHLPFTNPTIRTECLKLEDPRSRKIFQRRVMKEYCKHVFKGKDTLAHREKEFNNGIAGITYKKFLNVFTSKIDVFCITTRKIKTRVATYLRKIYAGGQDVSPKIQSFRDTIKFWRRIVRRKQGVLTSRTTLKLIAKRVKILLHLQKIMTLEQLDAKLTMAYRAYFKAQPEFPQ